MSVSTNRIVRSVAPKSLFPDAGKLVTSSTSWNQGDLLKYDPADQKLKVVAAEADNTTFCGIAPVKVVNGKLASPYQGTAVDAAQALGMDIPGPVAGVVAGMVGKTGDAFNPGDLVYGDPADPATVSSAGTKAIGIYVGPAIAGNPAGGIVECLLGHRYPADSLIVP